MARAKRDLAHWVRKALNSSEVRAQIKRVLVDADHKHWVSLMKILLPFAMVEAIKAKDGWTLKLPEETSTELAAVE